MKKLFQEILNLEKQDKTMLLLIIATLINILLAIVKFGFAFTIPWVIGFVFLYAYPLIMSLVYTFNDLQPATGELTWAGLKHYKNAFLVDSDYVRTLLGSLKEVAYTLPSVLVFSLVIALFLNQKFRSARFFRGIFFLPIIITSGSIISIMQGDSMSSLMLSGEKGSSMFAVTSLETTLREMGITEEIIDFVTNTANSVFSLSWQSGVQILLFLTITHPTGTSFFL